MRKTLNEDHGLNVDFYYTDNKQSPTILVKVIRLSFKEFCSFSSIALFNVNLLFSIYLQWSRFQELMATHLHILLYVQYQIESLLFQKLHRVVELSTQKQRKRILKASKPEGGGV